MHVWYYNVHIQSLCTREHTSRYSKPCFNLQEASPERFVSFYQRRPLELSMHNRYSNLHIQSLHAWEHTSRDLNPIMTSRNLLLKFTGHSSKANLKNSPCMLVHLLCTFKAYMLESTLPEIQNPALTTRKHLLKYAGYSTKGNLWNSLCMLDHLMYILFRVNLLLSKLLEDQYFFKVFITWF